MNFKNGALSKFDRTLSNHIFSPNIGETIRKHFVITFDRFSLVKDYFTINEDEVQSYVDKSHFFADFPLLSRLLRFCGKSKIVVRSYDFHVWYNQNGERKFLYYDSRCKDAVSIAFKLMACGNYLDLNSAVKDLYASMFVFEKQTDALEFTDFLQQAVENDGLTWDPAISLNKLRTKLLNRGFYDQDDLWDSKFTLDNFYSLMRGEIWIKSLLFLFVDEEDKELGHSYYEKRKTKAAFEKLYPPRDLVNLDREKLPVRFSKKVREKLKEIIDFFKPTKKYK